MLAAYFTRQFNMTVRVDRDGQAPRHVTRYRRLPCKEPDVVGWERFRDWAGYGVL